MDLAKNRDADNFPVFYAVFPSEQLCKYKFSKNDLPTAQKPPLISTIEILLLPENFAHIK